MGEQDKSREIPEDVSEEDRKYREKKEREAKDAAKRRAEKKPCEDAVRGCLVGGGVGDALGYPVEFLSEKEIRRTYGENGITAYDYSLEEGLAVVSDDTQMTMFTATGVLEGYTRGCMRGIMGPVAGYVHQHYLDWLHTQDKGREGTDTSWLREIPELHVRRAPGMTCLNALAGGRRGTCEEPVNQSKGCGGVMRVAPVALYTGRYYQYDSPEQLEKLMRDGAEVAAVTHGHPLGYLPAAALVHIINRIVYGHCSLGAGLYDITAECRIFMKRVFEGEAYLPAFLQKLDAAVELSQNTDPDTENIRKLGLGWVAEEAFAIALYCALRYADDFSKAAVAAVNHDGDSDSTGAITGNIVGAIAGYKRIDDCWKRQLEFHKLLVELADDLCYGCQMSEYSSYMDEDWFDKYMVGRKPRRENR